MLEKTWKKLGVPYTEFEIFGITCSSSKFTFTAYKRSHKLKILCKEFRLFK